MRASPFLSPAVLAAAVLLLASVPIAWGGSTPGAVQSTGSAPISDATGAVTTLTVGASVGTHLDSPFFGVNFGATASTPKAQAAFGLFFNSTPITWFRLGGGGDGYDPTTQTNYVAPASGGTYLPSVGSLVNFTWFESWCYSRTPHCSWMGYLPGEENNTKAAVHVANWFHRVLGFVPTLWQFGNEPTAWTHYGKNRSTWSTTDAITPTGLDYATMVKNYIAAVSALYPSDRYLGDQAPCACNPTFLSPLFSMDGSKIAGVAYHSYPFLNSSDTVVSQFFGALNSSRALANTSAHIRSIISSACASCTNLPIEVGEYQAGGPVPDHSPFATQYSGAPFIAASVIEAIQSNISMFALFDNAWLMNQTNGQVGTQGILYSWILNNMTMGTDYSVTVNVAGVGGVYALLVKNGTRESLLLVNTNSTRSLSLTLSSLVFPVGLLGSAWVWGPTHPYPTTHLGAKIPTRFNIAPQQILLLDNY